MNRAEARGFALAWMRRALRAHGRPTLRFASVVGRWLFHKRRSRQVRRGGWLWRWHRRRARALEAELFDALRGLGVEDPQALCHEMLAACEGEPV